MFRKFALFLALAILPLAGCKKVKAFAEKELHKSTPEPVATTTSTAAAAATPAAKPSAPPPPPRPSVNPNAEVVVLCYHRLEGKAGGALSIDPALFEKQMQELKDKDIPVISMQDFLAWRRGEKNIPPKAAIITIDDGYRSGYEVGWPVLKKFGYPFTMFVYLNYIEKGGKSITWEQLAEMRDAGVDIGSHTVSHQDLRHKPSRAPGDYDTWLHDEVDRSKKTIEEKLGVKVSTLAYPYGFHNEKVQEAVKAAGYEAAFTTYGQRLGISTNFATLGRYDVTTHDAQGHDSFSVAVSFEGMKAPGGGEAVLAQDAAAAMITEPMNGETVTNPKPLIKANLASMGDLDPGTVVMRISGLGLVPAKYDTASGNISYTPTQPLRADGYRVIITAKSAGRPVETGWNFNYSPDGLPPAPEVVPATPPPAPAKAKKHK